MRMGRTREDDSLNVSGINEFIDGVQSQRRVISSGEVILESGEGRASMMSCSGRECVDVSFLRCGRRWNKLSCGVARYMWPSTMS